MSKRQFKTHASSSRAAPATGFGGFGSTSTRSVLSYVAELPDLSTVSDPNVVVAFKNLSKSDSTTKTKALEVLQEYVARHPNNEGGGTEDPILEAWVKFYPRVSIHNNRRVREQAHNLQLMLLKSARKRMEKHIPDTVGSWLAGCYDKDNFVARAAQNGISSFLDTDKKVVAFWTRCQPRILDYAEEAINETSESLSDERNTSADDAQALYLRVVGSSISLVTNLLLKLKSGDIQKHQETYESFLQNKKLWALAYSEDPFVRKIVDHLLIVCLENQPQVLEPMLERLSHSFIAKALRSPQSTSSLQLLQALGKLTTRFPEVWTSAYTDKESSFRRLRSFVQKGSQGGPPEYWLSLQELLHLLPADTIPSDKAPSIDFLKSFKDAIEGREEPRQHAEQAWLSYFDAIGIITKRITDSSVRAEIFQEAIYSILESHLAGETGRNPVTNLALVKACFLWASNKDLKPQDSLPFQLQKLANAFIARSLTSAHTGPEESESHKQGQRKIIGEAHRWFSLLAEILNFKGSDDVAELMMLPSRGIFNSAVRTVISEDGRPYSAAATVEITLRLTPSVVEDSPEIVESFKSLVKNHLSKPQMITSPSSRHLVSLLYLFRSMPHQEAEFEKAWRSTIDSLLQVSADSSTLKVFTALLANDAASEPSQSYPELQRLLLDASARALEGDSGARSLFETAIAFNCYSEAASATLVDQVLQNSNPKDISSHSGKLDQAFKTLEFISTHKPDLLDQDKHIHIALITMLLEITEISDKALASRAFTLKTVVEKASKSSSQANQSSTLDMIRWNLELEPSSPRILLIETLVQQAKSFKNDSDSSVPAEAFFPDPEKWSGVLNPTLILPPSPALGTMRPFAGCVFLADASSANPTSKNMLGSVESKTFPVALRMALYTSNLVDDVNLLLRLPMDLLLEILHSLLLSSEIVNDQLDLLEAGEFPEWAADDDDEMDELKTLVSNTHLGKLINGAKQWQHCSSSEQLRSEDPSLTVRALIDKLVQTTKSGPGEYYATKALSHLIANLVDAHGWDAVVGDSWLSGTKILSSTAKDVLGATAILTGLGTNLEISRVANNFCNRLISDVAGASATSDKALVLIISLNAALMVYQEDEIPVAKNRIIFAVKQILSWTETLATTNTQLSSEVCRVLQSLLPAMKDVYGTYWESTLDFCISIWESSEGGQLSDENLPMIGMSLKLYSILQKIEDPNDDLEDALTNYKQKVSESLINLLKLRRAKDHQPLQFVDTLLLRQLRGIPVDLVEELSEFYPLLASDNRNLQSAAYDVLHRALLSFQQQISVEAVLEGKDARLPDELLSLLLDPPSYTDFSDEVLEDFPTYVRGYLLSWHLVYDSYSNASFKVRNDYSQILKSENYIGPLLSFLFDALGISAGKSINLEKQRIDSTAIREYDMWAVIDSESAKYDMRRLLVNLYYSCLKFTPNLVKAWWLDCRSKQTSIAVNAWTEEFFSPILIQEAKEDVSKWADEQEAASEDEKNLIIKVSKNTPYIQAGYEIDEMMMQIIIFLPDNYPLQGVDVRGGNRVAVKEKTWNSWLITTQGVMTFNNGSIIDAGDEHGDMNLGAPQRQDDWKIIVHLFVSFIELIVPSREFIVVLNFTFGDGDSKAKGSFSSRDIMVNKDESSLETNSACLQTSGSQDLLPTKNHSPFMSLPVEVRRLIYTYIVPDDDIRI
ncbi:hypothetical protein G7Y89_g1514 [Cudoniella acicularis]|uniref:E3 ubiquitin-protein ligase listerin n=1 Tax=Cudoniella acicularis TaxID=354080 RepID=A0A8H4RV45_9HELO|nr:hypothetical protein G7Y89_g1514 [Cudoniella acicularis]